MSISVDQLVQNFPSARASPFFPQRCSAFAADQMLHHHWQNQREIHVQGWLEEILGR